MTTFGSWTPIGDLATRVVVRIPEPFSSIPAVMPQTAPDNFNAATSNLKGRPNDSQPSK
jgi:hypothetical protein